MHRIYNILNSLDKIAEMLIYFIIIFGLWAFGSTEQWSIWTINVSTYALGTIVLIKKFFKNKYIVNNLNVKNKKEVPNCKLLNFIYYVNLFTFIMIAALLFYILISAINAKGSFDIELNKYQYFNDYLSYLPHSYDSIGTWSIFWQYLSFVILYYSIRNWISSSNIDKSDKPLTNRSKKLITVLFINGFIFSFEAVIQRLYYMNGTGNLLFLIEPTINKNNLAQFGSFAYRSNASSYLNMIWPMGFGLIVFYSKIEKLKFSIVNKDIIKFYIILVTLCASSPIISSSRGGALIMIMQLLIILIYYIVSYFNGKIRIKSIPIVILFSLILALSLGWENLEPRLIKIFSDNIGSRSIIYEVTIRMINDYGFWGSGPGSFAAISQFEIDKYYTIWESWAHSDYLEFYLTFGKPGILIILLIFVSLSIQTSINYLLKVDRDMIFFLIISMIGVLIHASMDFPLQVNSILCIIVIITALITSNNGLGRHRKL